MQKIIFKNGLFGGLIVSSVLISMTIYMKFNSAYEPSAIVGFATIIVANIFIFIGNYYLL